MVLFNPYLGGKGASYFSQGYLPESERNSPTGLRTHYNSAVHRFNHYTTRTPSKIDLIWWIKKNVSRLFKMASTKTESSRLEQRSVVKFSMVEKCKPCQIFRRMCYAYGEACFTSFFKFLDRGIIYYKLNYHDFEIRQALRVTYRTTGQLFRTYQVPSAVYTLIASTSSWEDVILEVTASTVG